MQRRRHPRLPTASTPMAGSFGTTTITTMPWLSTETKQKNRQRRSTRAPVHPVFGECAQLVCDPFWKATLEACVYGRFPRGCSYSEGRLTHRKKTRVAELI